MLLKPFILHAVLAWQTTLLSPVEQKTLVLQFENRDECVSIKEQIATQVKDAQSMFYLKSIECYPCREIVGNKNRCPPIKSAKKR